MISIRDWFAAQGKISSLKRENKILYEALVRVLEFSYSKDAVIRIVEETFEALDYERQVPHK